MPHLPDSHQDHDLVLVAALAAGDTEGRDHTRATELVTSCPECARVRDDLVTLAALLPTLPAPARTRDYRLTAEQAAALRPTGWRRLLGAFGGSGFRFATPVGTAMATLGIAGLLLSAVPSSLPAGTTGEGTSGSAPLQSLTQDASAPAASAGPAVNSDRRPRARSRRPANRSPARRRPRARLRRHPPAPGRRPAATKLTSTRTRRIRASVAPPPRRAARPRRATSPGRTGRSSRHRRRPPRRPWMPRPRPSPRTDRWCSWRASCSSPASGSWACATRLAGSPDARRAGRRAAGPEGPAGTLDG